MQKGQMMHKVTVKLDQAGHGTVVVDDKELPMVRRVDFHAIAGEPTGVILELIAVELDVEVDTYEDSTKVITPDVSTA